MENEVRFIPSREIVSAEARIALALDYFQSHKDKSFFECYQRVFVSMNMSHNAQGNFVNQFGSDEEYILKVNELCENMSPQGIKELENQLDYDLTLVQSGIIEEMFNLSISKFECLPKDFQGIKLCDLRAVDKNGKEQNMADYVMNMFGITKENNPKAYEYFSKDVTIFGFFKDIRNSISHNDEDDEILIASHKKEMPQNGKIDERRFILRSDFFVELECIGAKSKEDFDNGNLVHYEGVVSNQDLAMLLMFVEDQFFSSVNSKNNEQDKEFASQAFDNYETNIRPIIQALEEPLKVQGLAENCDVMAIQGKHNQDFLFEQKRDLLDYIKVLSSQKDKNFYDIWGGLLQDKNLDQNRTVFNMVCGLSNGIFSNAIYQMFSADVPGDVAKDVITYLTEAENISPEVLALFGFDPNGPKPSNKKLKEAVKTVTARLRNSVDHGNYAYDFDGGIKFFHARGRENTQETELQQVAHLPRLSLLELATIKRVDEQVFTTKPIDITTHKKVEEPPVFGAA